jgi:hypothetical protein
MKYYKSLFSVVVLLFVISCATYNPQYKSGIEQGVLLDNEIVHSFYFIGDAGNSSLGTSSESLQDFKAELEKASKNSTAVFLGDNIYPNGLPKKGEEGRAFAEHQLNMQTEAVQKFKGQTIFIPGNHDWYSGLKGLKRQEKYVEDILGKNTFLPKNGCPIKKVDINDEIVMIIIDSEWYIANWDYHPTINDDCDIKNRNQFFDEFESLLKKARGRTTLIAMHHPMFTNGPHGGQYDAKSHLTPVPILGTLKNILRKTSGISPADLQNKRYDEFKKRIVTLSQENDKAIFISGHEHSLQYLVQDNLPQIISGSGSKLSATRNVGGGLFSYGTPGYTRLDVFKDGSSFVRFYSATDDKMVFQTEVFPADIKESIKPYDVDFPAKISASIYTGEETDKGAFHRTLWGERYRKYYSKEVNAPTVSLDTLFGGLTPTRKGGGHQSKSLRLEDAQGREYVMRALRKNAVQYLQAVAFKDQYIEGKFEDTYTENLLLDVFTGAHPYAPFAIGTLSKAVGVHHTNPVLYYIPKQKALNEFNKEFGDELYMIEERAADGHGDKSSFGFANKIISTDDMLKKLQKNENHILDETAYIRARLFDMLIGDWDRHEDQWRWAVHKENDKTIYRPIPRDRDQAFSIMADGTLLKFATSVVPALRLMQSYDAELKSPKWFNLEPFPLDVTLITKSNREIWNEQVNHIVENLTDEVIDEAFTYFPKEVNDKTVLGIKNKLKGRRSNLNKISDAYYTHINKFAVITGTNKDDLFEIERMQSEKTKVTAYRIKKGIKGDVFHEREYSNTETKEIWIYGLDDDDVFKVSGNGNRLIKLRIIGGQNNDTYNIENGKHVVLYDYKSKENRFITDNGIKKLTDDYETNVYDYKKLKNSSNQLIPSIGANPDDGFRIGLVDTYTTYGFEQNPFTTQHVFSGAYYFSTDGFDFSYQGEFANIFPDWNLGLEASFTSPNFSINFFGFGNDTPNNEADDDDGIDVDLDYNRVKLSTVRFSPSLIWRGQLGSQFKFGLSYESIEVEETQDRFINTFYVANGEDSQNKFLGGEVGYGYENKDNKAFPTLGMEVSFKAGYKSNIQDSNGFGYVIPSLAFDYKLNSSGQLVLATKFKGHMNIGNNFEFYQGANLGANNGLRGYRNQRFTGQGAFYQSTDIRLNLRKVKTGLLPLNIGLYGGFDYGKVWVDNEMLLDQNHDSNNWNTSIGGGIFLNAANMITGNISAFNSHDGLRLAFAFGFGF